MILITHLPTRSKITRVEAFYESSEALSRFHDLDRDEDARRLVMWEAEAISTGTGRT